MKKRLQDIRYREREDSLLTYGRPSVSAWVAAAAVAFAFFVLGGFIKTYRQLETLREESRYEIAELREMVRRLREERMLPAGGVVRGQVQGGYQSPPRVQPLPSSRRDGSYPPQGQPVVQPQVLDERQAQFLQRGGGVGGTESQLRPPASMRPVSDGALFLDDFVESESKGPRYQIGRAYEGGESRLLSANGGVCQVISVSNDKKRLIVEGGRDLGLNQGARLELCRDGRWTADLRIVDVYDNQSACEVLHATAAPQPGDTIRRPPQSR